MSYQSYPSASSEPSGQQQGFGYSQKDTDILQEEALKSEQRHFVGVVEQMAEIQMIINKEESDTCDIMSTPAGARLLNWSYVVRDTWWYRLFSRIDSTFKKRIARLS
jgi:hypothetical protein